MSTVNAIRFAVILTMTFSIASPAMALRCGNKVVSEGLTLVKVHKICGAPTYTQEQGNCYFVTPMTLDLELEATDSTPATFSTSDGRSFTAGVIDSQLAVSQIADESILGVEVDTTTQFWTAAEGIMTIDLPECPPEVQIRLFRFSSGS